MFLLWLSWSLGASHLCIRGVEAILAYWSNKKGKKLRNHEKISLVLLLLHFTLTLLFFYNFFRGVPRAKAQLTLALINTVFLIFNANGYFRCKSIWHRFYSDDISDYDKKIIVTAMIFVGLLGLSAYVFIISFLVQVYDQEISGVRLNWDHSVLPLVNYHMVLLSILPWYLLWAHSSVFTINFVWSHQHAKSVTKKAARDTLSLYRKLAVPLLLLNSTSILLMCYSALQGIYTLIQTLLIIAHMPFLVAQAYGYFTCTLWHRQFHEASQPQPRIFVDKVLGIFDTLGYFHFMIASGIYIAFMIITALEEIVGIENLKQKQQT